MIKHISECAILIACAATLNAAQPMNGGDSLTGNRKDVVSPQNNQIDDPYFQFPTPGTWPGGLAWDGEYFWNQDADLNYIYKLTAMGDLVDSFPSPGGQGGLAWLDSCLWAVNEENYRLFKIDPNSGSTIEEFILPTTNPNSWGLTVQDDYLWYSEYGGDGSLVKIDPVNASLLFSFSAPNDCVLGIAWDGECLCGVDKWDPFMYRMDPNDGSVIETIPWDVIQPMGLLYDSGYFWNVSDVGLGSVYKIPSDIVGINLTPRETPIQIQSGGGTFNYEIALYNYSDSLTVCDIWSMAILPGGTIIGPLIDPITLMLNSGFDAQRYRMQSVPSVAPPGEYSFIWYVGIYSHVTYDSSYFPFEKLAGDGDSFTGSRYSWSEAMCTPFLQKKVNGDKTMVPSNTPNPFNPSTTISFALPKAARVSLSIYDVSGRLVVELVDGLRQAGTHEVTFDGSNLASGIYIYNLTAGEFNASGKMVLMK
jgi:hypothetical protein